jgi:bacteriorhodopsin
MEDEMTFTPSTASPYWYIFFAVGLVAMLIILFFYKGDE